MGLKNFKKNVCQLFEKMEFSMLKLLFPFLPLFAFSSLTATTVLVTGANRGIGLEFARQYKAKGVDVIATARDPDKAAELRSLGVRVEQLDVADPASVAALKKKLSGVPIDILINNAGVLEGQHSTFESLDLDQLVSSYAVNSIGPMRLTQALLPNLRAGQNKKIINISSTLGSIEQNNGGMYPYRASKAALNQLTKTMSIDLEKEKFICIVMHPGWVKTDMGGSQATYTAEQSVQAMLQTINRLDQSSNGHYLDLKGNQIPW